MTYESELEVKMIHGKMAESIINLNKNFKRLQKTMRREDFYDKYSTGYVSCTLIKLIDSASTEIARVCQSIDDIPRVSRYGEFISEQINAEEER